ncbi:ABC-type transport system, substrate-binding protein [Duganella sp. CF517]|uniref:ABC transporter substrate-binding protein n=1 Tax=Duganella sp. CF517 TaxID=1881038 RepID=UPI0008C68BC5|nr:ABC transporter substrate-binding protein [Duganella sp. CF517]SEO31101.1 ABC-type transport system, substrate-binding protein [Duganella sp. CF517]
MLKSYAAAVLALVVGLGSGLGSLPCAAVTAEAHTTQTASAPKVLRAFLSTGETGLDPAVASDIASLSLLENLFDPLLRYDYLARPVKLQANTLAAMPSVADDGRTYTFHLRQDVYFTDDPAFQGARRQVTAHDYVYSLKRLYDPALKSPWSFLLEGKIVGDAALKARFGYDGDIAGLQAVDKFTLRIRLNAADPNFLFYLAIPATGVVAREVVEAYGVQVGNHPVGTGPFKIGTWKRSDQISLLANRDFRPMFFQGRRLPLVDRVDIKIMEEYQSRVLGFLNGEFDFLEQLPESMKEMVLTGDAQPTLKPELARKGLVLSPFPVLQTYYMWMNMEDPLIGGYGKDKVALRRAIALSYNSAEDIAQMKKGLALRAETPLPPNVLGYDPAYRSPVGYDPALANALLDRHGYNKGPGGLRTLPDGKPLTLVMHTEPSMVGRLRDELWRKNLNAIGLRVTFKGDKKTEIIKASRLGTVMMFETNWVADFPDGDNFYQLLYGPNKAGPNYARFNLPAYNQRYEQTRTMGDSPARTRLYDEMAQIIHAYTPWVLLTHPISADVRQPWLRNYTRHPVEFTNWRYLDVDAHTRR